MGRWGISARAGATADLGLSPGYWRGVPPMSGGIGSMAGPASTANPSTGRSATQWHPTVVYLMGIILVEMAVFGALRYYFRSAHGG
jgi:hypothetical protein